MTLRTQLWATRHLLRSRMIGPMRPDRYLGMARILRRYGPHATTGFALAANRCPDAVGLVDERGALTWRERAREGEHAGVRIKAALGVHCIASLQRHGGDRLGHHAHAVGRLQPLRQL